MKRWVVLCLLMIPFLASADSYWEGNAALQRGDTAFESGLYASSNSFSPDTQLMVQNLENGKSAIVTVSQRTDGQSGILILLSPKAADALGVAPGSIARVRVTEAQKAASTGAAAAPENSYNPDSDVNPAAAYAGTPGSQQVAQQPTAQEQPTGQQPAAQEQQPAAQAEQPAAQQQQPTTAGQSSEDAEILAEAASRSPQKQLFLPPREDQKFAYKPATPAETAQTPQTAQPQQPGPAEGPSATGETAAPSQGQSEVPLAEAQPEPQPTPQEAGSSTPQPGQPEATSQLAPPATPQAGQAEPNGASPAPAPGGEKIALSAPETPPEQAAPQQATTPPPVKPPEQPSTAPVASVPPERQPGQAQVVSALPKLSGKKNAATFYVQLGAYATQEVAQGLAVTLMQTYPVLVLAPASSGKQMYRVLVGPLNKAESGTLLPLFKFKGFRDAFVRRE